MDLSSVLNIGPHGVMIILFNLCMYGPAEVVREKHGVLLLAINPT